MKPYIFLFMVFVGTILFYAGNETLFNNISVEDWVGQRILFGVGFGGLCFAFLGLMAVHQVVINALYLDFPDHLIRMYRGLHCDASMISYHRPNDISETKRS